ncbi:hypothetical protein DID73_02025 [Candidatus Marinamargulisbacteria bacterium SCGC AG-343-K17]|nr:hypothetical protein DID73_02025 [Candidatus Marinamargulisbacteria bacterium SCGC AG-343-K17]
MTYYLRPYQTRKETVFDELFNDFFNVGFHRDTSFSQPDTIDETDTSVSLKIEVPGFEKSEIGIDYKDNQLVIHAKSSDETSERRDIKRQYTIRNIDIKKSTADLKNGILTLTLEKNEASKSQQLKIK